jgi:hypothetical protein
MKHFFALAAASWAFGSALAVSVPADKAKRTYIDLQPRANHKLTEDFSAAGNNLAELPTGEQTFGGVKFKIGKGFIQLGSKAMDKMPEAVKGLKVGRAFARLHILHATQFGGGPNREGSAWFVKDDTPIGEYRVHYADKSVRTIPIVYGQHVRDWFFVDGEKGVSRGKVAWTGDNKRATEVGARLRLYMTTWQNPQPGKKVIDIDYVSKKDQTVAAPFCVAMTAEGK